MNFYELVFILRPDISSNEVDKEVAKLSSIITQNKGEIIKNEYWGVRNLAYPIHKNKKGHYVLLGIKTNRDINTQMEKIIKLNDNFIRFLFQKVNKIEEGPSAILENTGDAPTAEVIDVTNIEK